MHQGIWKTFINIYSKLPHVCLFIFSVFTLGTVHAVQIVKINVPVNFAAKAIEGASYEWEFPNGIKKTGQNVTFSFNEPGNVHITLKVKKGAETETITKQVTVQNPGKPTAIVQVTIDGKEYNGGKIDLQKQQSISFKSKSVSATGSNKNLNETWWVDGKVEDVLAIPHLFTETRLYPIKLIVSENGVQNVRDEVSFQIEVINLPPEIKTIIVDDNDETGQQVSIKVQAIDPDGEIEQYRFEILELNDVILAQVTNTDAAIFNLNQFPGEHQYSVRVTVKDNDGTETSKTSSQPINIKSFIQNAAPEVKVEVSPGNAGTTATNFTFTAQTSDADGDALRYIWTLPNGKKKTEKSFDHQFTRVGPKSIMLTVTDGIDTIEKEISIQVLKEIKNHPPDVKIKGIWPAVAGDTETIFKFYADISDPDNDDVKHLWTFESGKTSNVLNAAHRFEKPGTYIVKLSGTDGKIETLDEIVVQVVQAGEDIPIIDFENIINEEVKPTSKLSVEIASTKDINSCNPFNSKLLKILTAELNSRRKLLDSDTLSDQNRKNLEAAIALISEKIELIQSDPFSLRTEFSTGKIMELKDKRKEKIEAFKQIRQNKEEKNIIQIEILELSKAIRKRELKISNEILIEDILLSAKNNREKRQEKILDSFQISRLRGEVKIIEEELYTLRNNPFFTRTESAKMCLIRLQEQLTDADKIRIVKDQIQKIDEYPEPDDSRFLFADIIANTHTKLFFYGRAPKDLDQAIYFEWELGKHIHIPGQNISLRYRKPGLYKVTLKVNDGHSIVTDTITIKIVEKQKYR